MDLSRFKKIASDEKTTTLAHKDGHQIKIAHNKLKPDLKKSLEELPMHNIKAPQMFAEKGLVDSPDDQSQVMTQAPWANNIPPVPQAAQEAISDDNLTPQQKMYNQNVDLFAHGNLGTPANVFDPQGTDTSKMKFGPHGEAPENPNFESMQQTNNQMSKQKESEQNKQDWTALENEKKNNLLKSFNLPLVPGPSGLGSDRAQPVSDGQPQVGAQPQQDQSQNPMAAMDMTGTQLGALDLGMQGIQGQQQAESQFGNIQQQAAQAQTNALTNIDTTFNAGMTQKQKEIDSILSEVKSGKINPNHYMESKSAPAKVASAIGLILGGMGGGLMHQENPAMKFLNAQIDRDMNAQQDNTTNKLSLASHYAQELGNMQAGSAFAKATQMAIYASKINEAAGKTADPMAKARAQQATAQLMQQAIPYLHQAQAYSMLYGKEGASMPPEQKILMMKNAGMINEQQYAEGNKEAGSLQNSDVARKNLLGAFDRLNQQNTVVNRAAHAGFEPAASGAFENELVPLIKDKEGRVNEFEFDTAKKFKPQPGDTPAKIMQKRADLDRWIQDKAAAPTLQGLGIVPRKNININFKPRGQ